ncbi:MAG TPA: hypothetical protein VHF26_14135, partial [Trebonia sp.]|nr:hypothetical protein [Trebonia sp.]
IESGAVFLSMRHVSGRRPPPAAERSPARQREIRDHGLRAEMIANLAERVAGLTSPTQEQIHRLAAQVLSVLPPEQAEVDTCAIAAAARALQVEASRWARLRPGDELVYEWPAVPRPRRASG